MVIVSLMYECWEKNENYLIKNYNYNAYCLLTQLEAISHSHFILAFV